MTDKFISIITPIYNGEKYINDCYDNVLDQDYKFWEWIVVDDGSIDNTLAIMQSIAANDSRVKIYSLPENKGRGFARNMALSHVTGDYVAIWDADDLHSINHLGLAISELKNGYTYFAGAAFIVNSARKITGIRYPILEKDLLIHPALVIDKRFFGGNTYSIVRTVGGIGEDHQVLLNLIYNYEGYISMEPTTYYFEDTGLDIKKALHSNLISFKTYLESKIPLKNKIIGMVSKFFKSLTLMLIYLIYPKGYPLLTRFRSADRNYAQENAKSEFFERKYNITR
jgi:glycosyltransferase involved in cell wall biosynthesis